MIKYAMLIYERYVPLIRDTGTLEDAVQEALETIYNGEVAEDDGDLEFEIIEIAKLHSFNTSDHQQFFEKKYAEHAKYQKEQQDKRDREQFEKLKKKFGE